MIEHTINNNNNFINAWYMQNKLICDDLINLFENSKEKQQGTLGFKNNRIDIKQKNSTDLFLNNYINEICVVDYLKELSNIVNEYKKKYIYSDKHQNNWGLTEIFKIQRYLPNEGYHMWHTERQGYSSCKRHLTFMTYLNDVTDAGETEFYYQKLKVKPQKGLTLIWPVDWTHTHKGNPSPSQEKAIITGWYSFV